MRKKEVGERVCWWENELLVARAAQAAFLRRPWVVRTGVCEMLPESPDM